jgi:hypothetical protein
MQRSRSRGNHKSPLCDQLAQRVLHCRGCGGHDVSHGLAANRDADLLTATDRAKCLAQRSLQLSHANLAHVDTLASMRSPRPARGSLNALNFAESKLASQLADPSVLYRLRGEERPRIDVLVEDQGLGGAQRSRAPNRALKRDLGG